MRVAAVQLLAGPDPATNRTAAVAAVEAAGSSGADLVVLPEGILVQVDDPALAWDTLAEPLDGPFVAALCDAAARTATTVVAGTFEPVPGEDRVWNTVVVMGPDGLCGTYRKLHLFDALGWRESDRVRPGDLGAGAPAAADPFTGILVVDVGPCTLGVATCYDLRFPELFRVLAGRGADVVAVPAAWVAGPRKAEQWTALLMARAIENGCFVVGAGQPGPRYAGHSMVVDPTGAVLAACDDSARSGPAGMARALVDPARAQAARRATPVLTQGRFAVVPRS